MAALSDTMKQNIGMGAHELVAAAKAFLESSKDSGVASALAAENERLKSDMSILKEQVSTLASRLEAYEERRGPGRPPKAA